MILITGQSVNSKKIADCDCICEDKFFVDEDSYLYKNIIKKDDLKSCKEFCKTDYPNATYFAWIDDTFEYATPDNSADEMRNSCWCMKETEVNGKHRTGVTTGTVDCEPSEYTTGKG